MAKGTRPVAVRLPKELVRKIIETLERRNRNSREAPWTFSDFLRMAVVEKITKMNRSRGHKVSARKVADRDEWIGEHEKLRVPESVSGTEVDC